MSTTRNPYAFVNMWQENIRLHDEFAVRRTIPKAVRLVKEEHNEVIAETDEPEINKTNLACEIADNIMVLFGLAIAAGLTLDDMTDAIQIVNQKNAMKTAETHYLDPHTGKITRRKVDTTTRRNVSLKEAAQVADAIYLEMVEREEKARQAEADKHMPVEAVNRAADESGET